MKRKMRLVILGCILSLGLCACGGGAGSYDLPEGGNWTDGRYLRGNTADLIIFDGAYSAAPCVMYAAEDTVSFDGLTDGDLIKIYIMYVMETWPEQATVFAVEKTEDGEFEDIDPEIIESLKEYGWLD